MLLSIEEKIFSKIDEITFIIIFEIFNSSSEIDYQSFL